MKRSILSLTVAVLSATVLSVILSIIYSLLVTIFSIPSGANIPVNLVIKLLSIVLGCFMFVKDSKGALKGSLLGAVYFVVSAIVFNLISGDWSISWFTFVNLLYCAIVGFVVGMIKTLKS